MLTVSASEVVFLVRKCSLTHEEEALCKEAMEGCPVEAVGNDGA
jgi:hypothetical protein